MKFLNSVLIICTLVVVSSCKNNQNKNTSEKVSEEQVTLRKEKNMKILFVLTSHDQLGDTGNKTGFWIEEFANPYYNLLDKGATITLATPKGGTAPIDPSSDTPDASTEDTERFKNDAEAQNKIKNTKVLADMNADDFDAVFYPGGHGPLWDLANDENSIALIEKFNSQDKPVAFVCHAPAALKGVKNKDGTPLVKGKKVTGFTNSEEEAVQLTNVVPFLVEDMLKENGGVYSKKEDWAAYAIEDGNLITGQNPASSELVAEKLLKQLK
ncbi:type 1 glutamine amidotransferase domain-containing protein [uncultured Marixanthomonas sp.]|uniref:type 1 glutamine amidotransferase domain-containing protein n=1 Tax=uncultured Marixanthomonas sp. TaxID=757245 RepID=UPI0030DC12BD|tara:strand:+ start:3806 stop:4612 length:807 start_codon:yes stop_codon:yes gene_type:complete